jgi:hypothetical protein
LRSGVNRWRYHSHAWHFALDCVKVLDGQSVGPTIARSAAYAAYVLSAGANEQKIGTDTFDLRLDRSLRALPYADHSDHRRDTDDDSQHRQDSAHLVTHQSTKRHADDHC